MAKFEKMRGESVTLNRERHTWIYKSQFRYLDGTMKTHTKSFPRLEFRKTESVYAAGRKWAEKKQDEIDKGYEGNEKRATLKEFYENEWKPLKLRNATATMDRYNSQLENYILPEIGNVRLSELSLKHVNNYFLKISKTEIMNRNTKVYSLPSRAALDNHKKALSSLLTLAERYKYIDYNYTRSIDLSEFLPLMQNNSTQVVRRNAYTKEQVNILLKYLHNYEDKQFARLCELMIFTGLRPQELAALDINKSLYFNDNTGQDGLYHLYIFQAMTTVKKDKAKETGGLIIKSTKNDKTRNVYFSNRVYSLLIEQLNYIENEKKRILTQRKKDRRQFGWEKDNSAYFLFSHTRGNPFDPKRLGKKWSEFIKTISELPDYEFYSLRHTYATLMLYNSNQANIDNHGATLQAIADSLGHTIDVFIKHYVHPQEEYQKKLAFVDFLKN